MNERQLPYSENAEKGVICSMLRGGRDVIEEQSGRLTSDHFFASGRGVIFQALVDMNNAGKATDFITVTQFLRDRGDLDSVGGAPEITELYGFVGTHHNVDQYAETVRQKFVLRKVFAHTQKFGSKIFDEQDDVAGLLEEFHAEAVEIGGLGADADALAFVTKAEVIERLENIEMRYRNRGKISGLSTGFADLDRITDGLQGKRTYVFAGRPAMGKSAIGGNIAEHICIGAIEAERKTVAVFTIEMPREQFLDRVLFTRAQINLGRIRDGFMSEADFPKLQKAASDLIRGKLLIDDTPGLSIAQFRSKARKAVVKHKAKLIVIDYVQIMKGSSKRSRENRVLELTEIMQGIRETAKQLNVPIIVLAQVGRSAEERPGCRPAMADLKECGAIEEEANVVGLLYRPAIYAKTDAKRQELADKYKVPLEEIDTIAELEIAKNRHGGVGTIPLKFYGEYTRFEGVTTKLFSNNPDERQKGMD